MTSFLMDQLSWVVSLAPELGGWEHNCFIVERPFVRFEYKVPLSVLLCILGSHFCVLGSESFEVHLSYKLSWLSLLAL